ncbi:SPOR domain-containing protein [Winogradskyella sp. UBA3174]|uniref:SPOR domain-containing protein n=1 Tax=Winogradskyella sp. UBA3174 TaxID=1947785 RepID=UPI0025E6C644|nr:SPOR domain-containing protein [Winogradskyella sp. UBA3174]|tara:strand:+ start:10223 stop:10606 length:384 start_codon:yes stop_codon:yes gene_type:complete
MILKIKHLAISFFVLAFSLSINAQQGQVTIDQDKDIDKLLEYKKDVKTSKIYKIQIDQSVDPDVAQKMKSNFLNAYIEWPVDIVWNTPNYKVWVGNFATRLEADRALLKIKKKYMYANILQPKLDKD